MMVRAPMLPLWFLVALIASGEATDRQASAQSDANLVVGIEGHYRPGRWTGIRVTDGDSISSRASEIETRDGDGVRVAYEQPAPLEAGDWGYVVPGSEAAPLIIRGEAGELISTRFPVLGSPARGPSMIPLKMPWIVSFGDPFGIDQIGANELLNRDPLLAVSKVESVADIPDRVLGYDGVDLMIIGGTSREKIAALNEDQQQAIVDWIFGGGRLFLTLGESGPELLQAAPWLLDLLPIGKEEPVSTVKLDQSALETYTATQSPLSPFVGVRLPRLKGRNLITGRTTRRISIPVAAEYAFGMGRITVLSADLEDPMFAQWPQRLDLITRLTGSILVPRQDDEAPRNRATAYDDLAGQARATLDHFSIKRTFSFSFLSLILMLLIAAIGPLDYLLINRLLGRPLLGWVSVPLIAIGLSLVLIQQSRPVVAEGSEDHSGQRLNRLEFVDVDSIAGRGDGCVLNYLYTHSANRLDIDVAPSEMLDDMSASVDWMLTTPFGYPGETLGGIQIAIEDGRLPAYRISRTLLGESTRSSIRDLPLSPRSSKATITRFRFDPKAIKPLTMKRRPGSQLLQGQLDNPLPFDLLNGMLVYRNWVYLLPTRFPVGDRIFAIEELRQKNFRWHLSRQKALEESVTESEEWDPASIDSPNRVAEMLMFHRAVGGTRYTSLKNDLLSGLDLSHVLTEDRCMLIGRLAQPITTYTTSNGELDDHAPAGDTVTMLRLVLPVEAARSR